jgi:RND family efflux transporter MFP subunit
MNFISRYQHRFFQLAGLMAILSAALFAGCSRDQSSSQAHQLYTCGMHPQVVQDHPGNCPICGMKLVPLRQKSGTQPTEVSGAASNAIVLDRGTIQNMDLRIAPVSQGPVERAVRTVGIIDYDETALTEVSTKFRGWIEKLYVDSTGKQMHRGEPLFEIYSPELYLAQTEYVLALASSTNSQGEAAELRKNAAMTKLKYWDISADQITELEKTRQPKKTLRVNAPRDGIVVEKMVFEGQMVDAGARLYRLADLSTVWIQAQVYEQDLPFIKLGQEALVSLASQPDPRFRGRVTYVYPMVDEKTRTAKVRMEFHNPGYFLKPGMYATVEMTSELSPSAVLVPDMAVLRSGEKNTVFVALEGGKFEARTVVLGPRADHDHYQVMTGLQLGEQVVTSGQFMLDSESQLQEAIQKMNGAPIEQPSRTNKPPGMIVADGTNRMAVNMTNAIYICPMPEHVALQYDHSGNCPLCGMTLVPVTRETLAKIQPGGHIDYYTCPMPEHSDVRMDKGGKCPRCGMTLIPVMTQTRIDAQSAEPMGTPGSMPVLFTCPMSRDADVVSDKPGKCPKCEMDLVETTKVPHGKIAEENWRKTHAIQHP